MGYSRAGFDVVGVDIKPQPNYPFKFIQADAMKFMISGFDVIHASPPCQAYSAINRGMGNASHYPDLIADLRNRLEANGSEWVIENVIGAPLFFPSVLCGSMFNLRSNSGLWLRRHRLFETSRFILTPRCCHPRGLPSIGVYGKGTNTYHKNRLGRNITVDEQRQAMGINWTTKSELVQAIPPAYTKWIGERIFYKR